MIREIINVYSKQKWTQYAPLWTPEETGRKFEFSSNCQLDKLATAGKCMTFMYLVSLIFIAVVNLYSLLKLGICRPVAGVHLVSQICECLYACMYQPLRLLITSGVIQTTYDWFNKFYGFIWQLQQELQSVSSVGVTLASIHAMKTE